MGRWRRHLDPNIRKCSWLAKEDEILKTKFSAVGSQWSNISKFLEGRTAQQCRARWFQICPGEPQAARQNAAPAVHKRERHHDGVTIKASARSLLAKMDQAPPAGSKSKVCKSRATIRRGVSLASQAEALSQGARRRKAGWCRIGVGSPKQRPYPIAVWWLCRAGTRGVRR